MITKSNQMISFTDYKKNMDAAQQHIFATCVKTTCWMCGSGNIPVLISDGTIYTHKPTSEFGRCKSESMRLAFPERSTRLDSGA